MMAKIIGLADFPIALRNIVLEYLTVEELMKVQRVALGKYFIRGFWKESDKIIVDHILFKLGQHFNFYDIDDTPDLPGRKILKEFIALMIATKAQITGSFLLHCISEEISYEDIDIFVHEKFADKFESFFLNLFSVRPEIVRNRLDGVYGGLRGGICGIKNFIDPNTGMKFQLVTLNVLPEDFSRNKSFHCTRNTFDGKKLAVYDFRSIANRTINIFKPKGPQETIALYYRWAKYLHKGFSPTIGRMRFLDMQSYFSNEEVAKSIGLVDQLEKMGFISRCGNIFMIQTHRLKIRQSEQITFVSSTKTCDFKTPA